MPGNPYKEERRCIARMKKLIEQVKDTPDGIDRSLLVWEVKAEFSVSKRFINDFLDDYLTAGIIVEKDGALYGRAE